MASSFVLDASVAISWCFPGDPVENTPYSRQILKRLVSNDAVVPEVWAFEIANAIFVSHNRRKRINEQQVHEYLDLLGALPIRVEVRDLWVNVDLELLARRHDIAADDAAYLDLALRNGLPLATADSPLKRAALGDGIVLVS